MFERFSPEQPSLTTENFEEAQRILKNMPKRTLESTRGSDPLYFSPYDEESECITAIFHNRKSGNVSEKNLALLSKKEQEWDVETSDAQQLIAYFEKNVSSKEKEFLWEEDYSRNPRLFFEINNLNILEALPQEERIFMLAKASRHIENTPDDFTAYAEAFPEDIQKIKALFINDYRPRETHITRDSKNETFSGDYPDDTFTAFSLKEDILDEDLKKKLFSLTAGEMNKIDPELKDLFRSFDFFLRAAQKRDKAPEKLPEGFSNVRDSFVKDESEVSKNFMEIINNSQPFRRRVEREDLFDKKYEEFAPIDKAKILRDFLAYTQYAMVYSETFNRPEITEESVEQENYLDVKNQYGNEENFNPDRQSIIYPTKYEPIALKKETEEENKRAIEQYLRINPRYKISGLILEEFKNVTDENEKDQNTKAIMDFWNKNRSPLLLKNVCDALSSQNPKLAASELLDLIKKEKEDDSVLLATLYRLELGKMGISEKGVDYLGTIFDLGETYNKPEKYDVERISKDGAMGIYEKGQKDEERKLLLYFYSTEGLKSDENKYLAELLEITLDTLHMRKPGDTEEDSARKEKCLEELKKNYYKIANDKIFQETGVRLNNLSFREQGNFAMYFNEADENAKGELRDFVKQYGEEGIISFLSLEAGDNMGDKILGIGEKLDPHIAKAIFEKYAKIANLAESIQEYIAKIFEDRKDVNEEEMGRISNDLHQRNSKMLIDFSEDIDNYGLNREILEKLENYEGDLMLTASMFHTLIKEEKRADIKIEDFNNLHFQKNTAQELSANGKLIKFLDKKGTDELNEQEKKNLHKIKEMIKIYENNYKDKPEIRDSIVGGLKKILEEGRSDTEIYTLLQNDKVMAFCRFDENETGRLYFGSFNVDDILKSSAIGTSFLQACLKEQEEKQKTIEADCIFTSAIGECYIDKVGFSASEVYPMSKEILLKIEKEPDEKSTYKKMTREEIMSSYEENFEGNRYEENSSAIILRFDHSSTEMIAKASELVNEKKYRITRYFSSPGNDKLAAYLVFEKTN